MNEFLPNDKHGNPLWTKDKSGYTIKAAGVEIKIPKVTKAAKKVTVSMVGGPTYTVTKEKIIDCCRFLCALKKRAGEFPIYQVTMDTPSKGRFFISDKQFGHKWLTDEKGQLV